MADELDNKKDKILRTFQNMYGFTVRFNYRY